MGSLSQGNSNPDPFKPGWRFTWIAGAWWFITSQISWIMSIIPAATYDPIFFTICIVFLSLGLPIFLVLGYYAYKIGDQSKCSSLLALGVSSIMFSILYPPQVIVGIMWPEILQDPSSPASQLLSIANFGLFFFIPLFEISLFLAASRFFERTKSREFSLALWLTLVALLLSVPAALNSYTLNSVLSLAAKLIFACGLMIFGLGLKKAAATQIPQPLWNRS
jgi:hypothetical protein